MTRFRTSLGLAAAAVALLPPSPSAQDPGFEQQVRTLGLPGAGSKLLAADVTADGILDAVLMHDQELSLLHGPYLYQDVDGNAVMTTIGEGLGGVRDFAVFPEVGSEQAAGVLAVMSTGLELFTWDGDSGTAESSLLLGFADARHVASWTVDDSEFTVASVVEGDGSLRTAVLLNSSGALFSATEVVPLGKNTGIRDVELLNWDGGGMPELAVLRDDVIEVYTTEGVRVADFPVIDTGAQMALLHYDAFSKDRLARIDRDPQTDEWFLDVLDDEGVEAESVPLHDEVLELAAGYHDENDLPDALITLASGQVLLYAHQPVGGGSSFDPAEVVDVFPDLTSPPAPPVLAATVADMDGDGDGDVLAADASFQGWLAYGAPVDANRWLVTVDGNLTPAPFGDDQVRLSFKVFLPDNLPDAPITHVEVVTWTGSSETVLDPATRQSDIELLPGVGSFVPVGVVLPRPELGSELHYVAEVRLIDAGPSLHAYPAIWGDVTITFEEEEGGEGGGRALRLQGGGGGGGVLRGTFIPVPAGPPPSFPVDP